MAKDIDVKVDYIQDKVDEVVDVVHRIDKEVCAQKVAFDDHLAQDERMFQEFVRMNNILQQQHDSLKEHMHRSDLLEDIVRSQGERLNPIETKHIKDQIVSEYRQERKAKIKGWLILGAKITGTITAVIGLILTIRSMHGH
jgi:hypothetical protein